MARWTSECLLRARGFWISAAALLLATQSLPAQTLTIGSRGVRLGLSPDPVHAYSVTPLGSDAVAIDAQGRVALMQGTQALLFTPGEPHGSVGTLTPLGTLGGTVSVANGLNSVGHATGYSTLSDGAYRAFLWSDGSLTDIGTLSGDFSSATGINDVGQIVGFSYGAKADERAFLWTPDVENGKVGTMLDLGTLGGEYSEARAISAAGMVVGFAYTQQGAFHAFRWTNGGPMVDLGTLGGSYSKAQAINAAGRIVGQGYLPGNAKAHACLWDGGPAKDLGNLGGSYSEALAIDTSGQHIVGEASVPGGSFLQYHAFFYAQGTLHDLNDLIPADSGWVLQSAADINDAGQIVGAGQFQGVARGFLLTPK